MGIAGTWYNQFGSTLIIGPAADSSFELEYQTAVSSGGCAQGLFSGTGYYAAASGAVGFCILWENAQSQCNSVTSWCGQYKAASSAPEEITAIWLLTAQTEDNWAPTMIGEDQFTRSAPQSVRSGQTPHA